MKYIKSIQLNLFNGLLTDELTFEQGLNIVAGENGTCKTNILRQLKANNNITVANQESEIRTQAISPKRNSERKSIETVIQQYKSQNRTIDNYISERINAQINDNTFDNYPSFGDIFYVYFEKLCRSGGSQVEFMNQVTQEFNEVVRHVFDNYELITSWNQTTGTPRLIFKKNSNQEIPLESLSCGEQEVLSLILNLHASRDSFDTILIDEPEVHLNWHLEEKLFRYLNHFSTKYSKQLIITTHSRVIFKSDFLPKTQFLYWLDGKIKLSKTVSEDHKRRIAGEAIEIIKLGEFKKPTFFVEDSAHKLLLEIVSSLLDKEITISESGNSSNVRSLFKLSLKDGGWPNAYFLQDGDNQGNPFPTYKNFIHCNKYCIENYALNFNLITDVTGKTIEEIKNSLIFSIKEKRSKILEKNKFFEFLVDRMTQDDLTQESLDKLDASEIMDSFISKIGTSKISYLQKYFSKCKEKGVLKENLPSGLFEVLSQ